MRSAGTTRETTATLLGEPLPVELMNTVGIDRDGVRDSLASDTAVAAWLNAVGKRIGAEAGIKLDDLDEEAVRPIAGQLRGLRDALRLLAAEATADTRPPATAPELTRPEAIATLNALAKTWPELVWPAGDQPSRSFRTDGTRLDLVAGLLAHQGVELFTGDRRDKLRPCLAPNCSLFFVKDHGRREWCSPACGNRARVTRHYRRHHPSGPVG